MAGLDAFNAFGSVFTSLLGLGLNESQNRRTNELDWHIAQDNLFAAEKLNTQNLDAARENWKREQSNFEKQREWSLQDRAYENWYNSPSQVAARYRQAGLNPALMMQGQGAASSVQANQGQAPNFGAPPTPIPERNDFHYTPMNYEGLGAGMAQLLSIHQAMRDSERADYALAADITFRDRKSQADFMNARAALKRAGVDDRRLAESERQFNENLAFEKDKFAKSVETDNARLEMEAVRLGIEKQSMELQKRLAQSKINVDNATINKISVDVLNSREQVQEMIRNGVSKRYIDQYVAEKEREIYESLARQNRRDARNDTEGVRQTYRDVTEWLLSPLKGIISVGIK